jgi:hypothetical protein
MNSVWKNVEILSVKQAMLVFTKFFYGNRNALAANTISFTPDYYLLCHHPIHIGVATHSDPLFSHCGVFSL